MGRGEKDNLRVSNFLLSDSLDKKLSEAKQSGSKLERGEVGQ